MSNRKPKTQERAFPVFESIGQASARLGVSESLLKAAKRKGCKAFISGSRVDSEILIPFLFRMLATKSELPEGMASPMEWLTTEKAKREAIRRQHDEGLLMPWAEAIRRLQNLQNIYWNGLKQMFRELPAELEHQDRKTIFAILDNRGQAHHAAMKKAIEATNV